MNSRPPNDGPPPPPPAPSPRDELEARLTALALGEAGEFETETLRARIAAEPDLAALYRRIEAAALAFKNTFEDERTTATLPALPEIPERLSAERRAILEKLFASTEKSGITFPAPKEQPATLPWLSFDIFRRRPFTQILAAAACLTLLACLSLFYFAESTLGMKQKLSDGRANFQVASASAKDFEKQKSEGKEMAEKNPAGEKPADAALAPALASNNAAVANFVSPRILTASELVNSVAQNNTPVPNQLVQTSGNPGDNFGINLPTLQPAEPPVAASGPSGATMSNSMLATPDLYRVPNPPAAASATVAPATPPSAAMPLAPPPPPPPPPPASLPNTGAGRDILVGSNGFGAAGGASGGAGGRNPRGGLAPGSRGGFGGGGGGRLSGGAGLGRGGRGGAGGAPAASAAPASTVAPADILIVSGSVSTPAGVSINAGTPLTLQPAPAAPGGSSPNSSYALGTGAVTILGGNIENTSGSATPIPVDTWNGNFSYAGTNSMALGTAAAEGSTTTLNANRTVTIGSDTMNLDANTLTVGGVISDIGAIAFNKTGTGTLTLLNGTNPYTGSTIVAGGTLQLGNGTTSGALGNGSFAWANGGTTNGSIVNDGTLTFNEAGATTYSNVISGAGSPAQADGAGALTFQGGSLSTNNLGNLSRNTGGTILVQGGTHTVSGVLDSGTFSNFGGDAELRRDEGPAVAGGSDQTAANSARTAISLNGSSNTYPGGTTLNAGTLTLSSSLALQNDTLNYLSYGGNLSFGDLTSANIGGLSGNSNLSLNNANDTKAVELKVGQNNEGSTYSGATTMTAGTVQTTFAGNLTVSGGALFLNAAATPGSGPTFNGGTLQYTGPASFTDNPSANNANATFVGDGAGTTSVTKAGTGTWAWTGLNTYAGVTNISTGTLQIGSELQAAQPPNANYLGTLSGAGALDMAGAGILTLDGNNQVLSSGANTTLQAGNSQDSQSYSGMLFGRGALSKAGSGTLTLAANNTYNGTTTVTGGLINFNDVKNFGSGNVTLLGGGLQWASGTTDDISQQINSRFGGTTTSRAIAGNDALDTNGNDVTLRTTLSGIKSGGGSLSIGNGTTLGGGTTLDNGSVYFGELRSGTVTANVTNSSSGLGLTKTGNGTLTLTGVNTFTGNTTLAAGTLQLGNALALNRNSEPLLAGSDEMLSQSVSAPAILAGRGLSVSSATVAANKTTNSSLPPAMNIVSRADMLQAVNDGWARPNVYNNAAPASPPELLKLSRIVIPNVNFSEPTPLDQVVAALKVLSEQYDPAGTGVNLKVYAPAGGPMPKVTLSNLNNFTLAQLLNLAAKDAGYYFDVEDSVVSLRRIPDTDAPASRPPSEVKFPAPVLTSANAFSTFSLNVSDTAFQLARAALQNRRWPAPASTRTEEFLNAFQYHDPVPAPGEAAALHYDLGQNPVESGGNLLRVSFQTAAAGRDRTTPLHLTLLLDGSGSMTRADRVATLQAAVRSLGTLLRPGDTASLVTFARTATVRLNAVPAERFEEIVKFIGALQPDGGTNMEDALQTAYAIARANYDPAAQNRVILLTDGAANLGELEPQALAGIVETNRKAGIALDAYGVGWDGLDDTTLEALTRKSDGRYAFLNSPADVNAAFANKLAGALTPAANDVKIQIEFNPQRVTSYRLMGYNNLRLTQQQFRDNNVNAGEMAATEQGTALYGLVINAQGSGPIGTARARYRDPGTTNYHELTWTIQYNGLPPAFDQASPALRLAAVAAYFAEYLQQSPYASDANPRQLLELLRGVPEAFAPDTRPTSLAEALTAAASLAGN